MELVIIFKSAEISYERNILYIVKARNKLKSARIDQVLSSSLVSG